MFNLARLPHFALGLFFYAGVKCSFTQQPPQTPPKFHEKTPREGRKKERILWREREKKREILGSPPFKAPPFGALTLLCPHPSGPPPFGAPTLRGTTLRGQSPGPPSAGQPKILPFFPSPAPIFAFLSLGVFSWNFGGFCDRDPQMCTSGLSGCGVPGLHTTTPSNTTKIPRKDPQERERRIFENCGGRREKKSEILGCLAEGCPVEGCPAEGCPAEGCPAEGCPAEGCPAESLGCRVRCSGFSSGFWGQKQKQNKNKLKSER